MKSTTFVAVVLSLMAQVDCQGNNKKSIRDETLLSFCTGPLLDNPDGYPPNDRIKDNYCAQKMNFKVPKEMEKEACQDLSPFPVKNAANEKGFLKCEWESTTRCRPGHIHIYDHCLSVGTHLVPYSDAKKSCENVNMKLHFATERDAMWISILLADYDLLWVSNTVTCGTPTKTNAVWTAVGGGSFVESVSNDIAIHLDAEYEFDVNAGQLVTVKEGEELRPLCSYKALKSKYNDTNVEYFIPSVLIQPDMTSDHQVDTTSFHKICAERKQGYRAGVAGEVDKLDKHMEKEGVDMIYVANQLNKHKDGSSNCDPKFRGELYAREFDTILPANGGFKTQKRTVSNWQKEKPDNLCSDYGRMAVAYEKGKGAVDVPPIARHPIICVPDENIKLVESDICPKNSHVVDGDGCECNEGLVDYANTTFESEFRQEFPPGTKCIHSNCQNEDKKMHMIFVVDNSGSINPTYRNPDYRVRNFEEKVIPFLQTAKHSLNKKIKITYIQYSSEIRNYTLESNWKDDEFDNLFGAPGYLDQWTCTADALQRAKDILDQDIDSDERRVILITDGYPTCTASSHLKHQMDLMTSHSKLITGLKNTKMLAVGIGPLLGTGGHQALMNAVGPENYMNLGGEFNKLAADEMKKLTSKICTPLNDASFGVTP